MKWTTQMDLKERLSDEAERSRIYGPPPVNPFTVLRESHGLTYAQLSKQSHIDPMALKRAEWGTYAEPLPSLLDYWTKRGFANVLDITTDYSDYVAATRRRHLHFFGPNLDVRVMASAEHPFRQLRAKRLSVMGTVLPVGLVETAKALCVPLDTIQFFEQRYAQQKSVPKTIKAALNQIGYHQGHIRAFEANYLEWRTLKTKQVSFS